MTQDELRNILSEHLAKFRERSYARLAERVERDQATGGYLEHLEAVAPDGTEYQMAFLAAWDGKRHGDVRVLGDLSVIPQMRLLGFLPVYLTDVTDSFIMSPDGRFVGESGTP
jgi:hypothetical protein